MTKQACLNKRKVTDERGLSVRALFTLDSRLVIRLAIFSAMIFSSLIAKADVITEKKANFRVSAAAIKAINAALSDGDFDVLITQATAIANLARVVPDFFLENNDMSVNKARTDIWMDFDGFKSCTEID